MGSGGGKKGRLRKRKHPSSSREFLRKVVIAGFLAFFLGVAVSLVYLYPGKSVKVRTPESVTSLHDEKEKTLLDELLQEEEAGKIFDEELYQGKICLVMDDGGYERERMERFLSMGVPVTVAILPGGEFSRKVAREAKSKGSTVLLHMPMQAEGGIEDRSSSFMLRVGMTEKEIWRRLRRALAYVPGATGISNHMGSRFTRDSGGIRFVTSFLRKKGLYFLDSKTTVKSVIPFVCKETGVRFFERDVFLDNEKDREEIAAQFEKLKAVASERGYAIGILHPAPGVLDSLEELVKEALLEGYRFATLDEIARSH